MSRWQSSGSNTCILSTGQRRRFGVLARVPVSRNPNSSITPAPILAYSWPAYLATFLNSLLRASMYSLRRFYLNKIIQQEGKSASLALLLSSCVDEMETESRRQITLNRQQKSTKILQSS